MSLPQIKTKITTFLDTLASAISCKSFSTHKKKAATVITGLVTAILFAGGAGLLVAGGLTGSLPFLIAGTSAVAISVPLAIATIILAVHTHRNKTTIENIEETIDTLPAKIVFHDYIKDPENWISLDFPTEDRIKAQALLQSFFNLSLYYKGVSRSLSNESLDVLKDKDTFAKKAHAALLEFKQVDDYEQKIKKTKKVLDEYLKLGTPNSNLESAALIILKDCWDNWIASGSTTV